MEKLNDEELEKQYSQDIHGYLQQARNGESRNEEFSKQQHIYSKFAENYDRAVTLEKYSSPLKLAEKINSLFPKNKSDVRILDYSCGTGLVADNLFKLGFTNIDGLDPNGGLIEVAKSKKVMKNFYQLRSDDNHDVIPSATYDVICSSGAFFLSSSHPGFECFHKLCNLIKKGGYLMIATKSSYLEYKYVDYSVIKNLEHEGVVKSFPKELYAGHRKTYEFEDSKNNTGTILVYEVL